MKPIKCFQTHMNPLSATEPQPKCILKDGREILAGGYFGYRIQGMMYQCLCPYMNATHQGRIDAPCERMQPSASSERNHRFSQTAGSNSTSRICQRNSLCNFPAGEMKGFSPAVYLHGFPLSVSTTTGGGCFRHGMLYQPGSYFEWNEQGRHMICKCPASKARIRGRLVSVYCQKAPQSK